MDHLYVSTITGLCARNGCGKPMADHPTVLTKVADTPMTMCPISHDTLIPRWDLTDDGYEWLRCPACNVQVEAALRMDVLMGRYDGKGRGDLTYRQKLELSGKAGWWAYNGGDNG